MADATATARSELRRLHRAPEPEVLKPLIRDAWLDSESRGRVTSRAREMLGRLRAAQASGWVNQFLQEYRLNTQEGVALLSLAEAFLRVPDPETADQLIADKLGDADWRAHAGKSHSTLVNSATWGLVIGRALVSGTEQASALKRLISRAGEPFVRQGVGAAMRMMGEIFVMGRNIDEAIGRMAKRENAGFTASFDMLGESARTFPDAERYFRSYQDAIRAVGRVAERGHSISVKLSALHPRYEVAQYDRCIPELIERVEALAALAKEAGIPFTIDAEESERLEMSLDIIEAVAGLSSLKGWDGLGMAVQAYGKRCRPVLSWANDLGRKTGRKIAVRLVKGAYWDSEIKRTQEQGLPDYPLFTRKAATDVSYLACAKDMLGASNIYPAFATHNALTVATILEWAGTSRDFEFQRLHGMGEGLYEAWCASRATTPGSTRPVGGHRDLLAYLVRRLLENGANSSFVHQLADERLSDADLIADPVAKIAAVGGHEAPGDPAAERPVRAGAPEQHGPGFAGSRGIGAGGEGGRRPKAPPLQGRGWGGECRPRFFHRLLITHRPHPQTPPLKGRGLSPRSPRPARAPASTAPKPTPWSRAPLPPSPPGTSEASTTARPASIASPTCSSGSATR
jgi:RHH-type proline utilization regulon transcriptional repressor/proline dehydrogenase/delta 1-pyrroline-5-carboxylate dehydrogenase